MPASSSSSSNPSGGEDGKAKEQTEQEEREPGRRMPPPSFPVPRLSSVPSAAYTVHTIARSSLPSSSAVPVILRPDLVRSISSVRPSVFLFLVPRSSLSFLPTDCQSNAIRSLSHQLTPSPGLEGFNPSGSGRDTIATTSTPTTSQGGPPLPAHPADPLHPAGVHRHMCGHLRR